MEPKIGIAFNGCPDILDGCLTSNELKGKIWGILTDRREDFIETAKSYGLNLLLPDGSTDALFSQNTLSMCDFNQVDYIIDFGFPRSLKISSLKPTKIAYFMLRTLRLFGIW